MLTARQMRAIDALMTERDTKAAATSAGVSRATMHRWLNDATFCDALRHASDAALAATVRRLASLSASAVDVLADSMSTDSTPAIRLRAADVVLARLLSLRELHDLAERVAALEAANVKP